MLFCKMILLVFSNELKYEKVKITSGFVKYQTFKELNNIIS